MLVGFVTTRCFILTRVFFSTISAHILHLPPSPPPSSLPCRRYGFGGIETLLDMEMGCVITSPLKLDTVGGGSSSSASGSKSGGGSGGSAAPSSTASSKGGGGSGGGGGKGGADSGKGKGARNDADAEASAHDHLLQDPLENMPAVPGASGLSRYVYAAPWCLRCILLGPACDASHRRWCSRGGRGGEWGRKEGCSPSFLFL